MNVHFYGVEILKTICIGVLHFMGLLLLLLLLLCRRRQLDAIFVINVLLGFKSCPSTLDIIGLRVPTRTVRDFSLFHVSSFYKNCPSGRCVIAANLICNYLDFFRREFVTLNQM
jgi:hypothetical protein